MLQFHTKNLTWGLNSFQQQKISTPFSNAVYEKHFFKFCVLQYDSKSQSNACFMFFVYVLCNRNSFLLQLSAYWCSYFEWGRISGSLQDSIPYKICSKDRRYIFVIIWMFEWFQFSNWVANSLSFLKSQRNFHRFYTACQLLWKYWDVWCMEDIIVITLFMLLLFAFFKR